MKYLLSVILYSMSFTQNISFYDKDGESFADVNIDNFTFNCRVAGVENKGEAVILLHGFPETSRMWYQLIPILANEGFKVIAPDQRGYSQGARPSKISDYTIDKLSKDITKRKTGYNPDSTFTPLPKNITPLGMELDPDTGINLSNSEKK